MDRRLSLTLGCAKVPFGSSFHWEVAGLGVRL